MDVFKNPLGVDEDTAIEETGLHAYGLHRRLLEKFVECQFTHHLIVRLPGSDVIRYLVERLTIFIMFWRS